ncbi:MAG TPA: hypothetical protein VM683_13950 [Anaeromyxobacteraceae bacterium]|jgi:hypothetical protein|nr:hypothetical protein [Anaeromyxobacteraceae bacterium]
MRTEPVVRIRCRSPEDAARSRRILQAAGLAPEESLTWLVVRDAHPDAVNLLLVEGGALGRTIVREDIGKLVGWLIDRQGALAGRARNVKSLVERTLANAGLAQRYAPRPDDELTASAEALNRTLMAEGAPLVTWDRFLELFCVPR